MSGPTGYHEGIQEEQAGVRIGQVLVVVYLTGFGVAGLAAVTALV